MSRGWEPISEEEVLYQRSRNTFSLDKRNEAAAEFIMLYGQSDNTSIGIVKEIGWYLWLYFHRINRRDISWFPPNEYQRQQYRYRYLVYSKPITFEEMREEYDKRFDVALSVWTGGPKQKRLGNNFLAILCQKNKGNVSHLVNDWARHHRRNTGTETPEEIAAGKTFNLLFLNGEEYGRIMDETDDIIEAAEKCEVRRLEILEERKRFSRLYKKLSSNLFLNASTPTESGLENKWKNPNTSTDTVSKEAD